MKRSALAILFLGLAFAVSAWAAPPATSRLPRIHVEGGYGFPQAPDAFSRGWKPGLGIGGGLEAGVRKNVSLCLDVDYNHHGLDEKRTIADFFSGLPRNRTVSGVIIQGGSAYILTTMAGVMLEFPTAGRIAPYLKLGAGVGHVSQAEQDISFLFRSFVGSASVPAASGNRFASSVGVGLRERTPGSKIGYTLEARWVRIATEGKPTQMIPVRVGLHLGF